MTTNTDTRDLMGATAVGVSAIAVVTAIAVGYAVYTGAILWLMWGWFMVPLGVVPITIAWAIGLTVMLGLFVRPISGSTSKDKKAPAWHDLILRPLFILGVGYIAKQFM